MAAVSLAEIEAEFGEGGSEGGIAGERLPGADTDRDDIAKTLC
jgi:hypothetical protein